MAKVAGGSAAVMIASVDESAVGLTWMVDEPQVRTSHALVDNGRVWLVDPVDDTAPRTPPARCVPGLATRA